MGFCWLRFLPNKSLPEETPPTSLAKGKHMGTHASVWKPATHLPFVQVPLREKDNMFPGVVCKVHLARGFRSHPSNRCFAFQKPTEGAVDTNIGLNKKTKRADFVQASCTSQFALCLEVQTAPADHPLHAAGAGRLSKQKNQRGSGDGCEFLREPWWHCLGVPFLACFPFLGIVEEGSLVRFPFLPDAEPILLGPEKWPPFPLPDVGQTTSQRAENSKCAGRQDPAWGIQAGDPRLNTHPTSMEPD